MRHTPIEVAETEARLAAVERQIHEQQSLLAALRSEGQPTHRASQALNELHQKADRNRDHIRLMRMEYEA